MPHSQRWLCGITYSILLMKNLFCFNNAKTTKGEAFGWRTAILYLAPASLSGENLCTHSTAECRELCLNTAGMAGVFKNIQASRIKKTKWMLANPSEFWSRVDKEITSHENYTHRQQTRLKRKFRPCVRLNGTTDVWNTDMETIMHRHPDVMFYDYTKDTDRMMEFIAGDMPINYHLTYSFSGTKQSKDFSDYVIQAGYNVAVVFDCAKGKPLTTHWRSYDVIDGDKSDLRFLDDASKNPIRVEQYTKSDWGAPWMKPEGWVIGLRAKGKAVGINGNHNSFVQPNINDE
jgi:hypothetical protein